MTTMWHPPGEHRGAMIYEGPENSTIDQVAGNFETITTDGGINVTPDGVLIVILPTADPLIAGALWNDSGTPTVSAGPGPS